MTDQRIIQWLNAVETDLGLSAVVDDQPALTAITELDRRVREQVDPTAVAGTAFLIGVAAGRAEEPGVAARDIAQKLGAMAEGWNSDSERGVPSNDQSRRG